MDDVRTGGRVKNDLDDMRGIYLSVKNILGCVNESKRGFIHQEEKKKMKSVSCSGRKSTKKRKVGGSSHSSHFSL